MDKMKVSQKIAELRARNGLTAKELGDKIEKSAGWLYFLGISAEALL